MNDKKKRKERKILEQFRVAYPAFPDGPIIESEAPDFTVTTASTIVGFELRSLVRDQRPDGTSPKMKREAFWQEVAGLTENEYAKVGNAPVHASFHWYPVAPSKSNATALAVAAAQFVATRVLSDVSRTMRLGYEAFKSSPLEREVRTILVTRLRPGAQSRFRYTPTDFIEAEREIVQHAIDTKNSKVAAYRSRCDKLWLILWAGGAIMAEHAMLDDDVRQQLYLTPFDRLVFFDLCDSRVIPLRIAPWGHVA